MATARKLPSGQYRVQIYIGTDSTGKKIRKSFTASSKKQAEYAAAEYLMKHKYSEPSGMTFGEAASKYIDSRKAVLSPSTIREYKRILDSDCRVLKDYSLEELTQEVIQDFVNDMCKNGDSSKSVRNVHGFISPVLNQFKPDMKLRTALPAKKKPDLYIPSDTEVVKVVSYIRDNCRHDMLIAVLLGAYGPMRRSEICALQSEDVNGNMVHVHSAMVDSGKSTWVIKDWPKTEAGNRYIMFPDFVIKELKGIKGPIVDITPNYITKTFSKVLKRSGVPHFRFHDLRHYSASIQHAMGIPDAYIMARGGWESDEVLKRIYRHAMDKEAQKANNKINSYFSKLQK